MTSGPTLDASGILASRLLDFLSSQRPSAQEKLGDRRLDMARQHLAQKNGDRISTTDLKLARDKVIRATEIKAGLESKTGFSKYLQAREYRKFAKEALRFVKTVSDRAGDEVFGQRQLGFNPVLDNSIDVQLFTEMKANITTRVEYLYHFKTRKAPENKQFNVELAKMLLRDINFIYPEPRDDGKRHTPYSHPIIQEAINMTLFRDEGDVGVVHHEHFSPMPIPIIALILTVVQCCIDEWSDGQRRDSNWNDDKIQAVYTSHVSSLFIFQAHGLERNVDVLYQLQWDLLRNAQDFVTFYRIARSQYRCWLSCMNAFPPSLMQDKWVADAWDEACSRVDIHPDPLRRYEAIKCDSMKFLADMKSMIKHAVDSSYEFDTSRAPDCIGRNASRAQALLDKATFIYRDLNSGERPRYPYRHPIIQKMINITWFQNKDDIGIVFREYFNPIPLEAIALVLTMIECCIDEWTTGTCRESSWKEADYKAHYLSHLNSLRSPDAHGPHQEGRDLLRQIQDDLLRAARIHAGATTGSRMPSSGALDVAVQDDHQLCSSDPVPASSCK